MVTLNLEDAQGVGHSKPFTAERRTYLVYTEQFLSMLMKRCLHRSRSKTLPRRLVNVLVVTNVNNNPRTVSNNVASHATVEMRANPRVMTAFSSATYLLFTAGTDSIRCVRSVIKRPHRAVTFPPTAGARKRTSLSQASRNLAASPPAPMFLQQSCTPRRLDVPLREDS